MALITKRGTSYRVQIRRKGYPSESATFPVRAQAVQWAALREAEIIGSRHGIIPRRTVRQALERYRDEVSPAHRGAKWEQARIAKFLGSPTKRAPARAPSIPFVDRPLGGITRADVADWRDAALLNLSPGSVRREFGLLRAVFSTAAGDWGWLKDTPFVRGMAPDGGKPRTRRVSDAETDAIIAALGYVCGSVPTTSSHLIACAFLLALETMMRQGEILSLTADQLNAAGRFLTLTRTKNGDTRDVPLTPAALALLALLPDPCFPVSAATCDTLFRRAVKAAGIEGLHFHDSRREATTRLAKKLDVLELAKAGGWRDVNMLLRVYYSASASVAAAKLG